MELKDRIKQRREELGLSQDELAKRLGYKSRSSINKIELGKTDISQSKIKAFAKALETTHQYLLGDEEQDDTSARIPNNLTPVKDTDFVSIPVIGRVAAGMNCLAESNIIGYESVLRTDIVPGEDYVFLRVIGDSMYPEFKEGDYVLVRLQTSVDSGSYAVVIIDGEEGVIKKVVYDKNYIELRSINPMYPPRRFEGADVLRVSVYGLVKEIKMKF
ncbi:MAG: helix-turn-helix domain-containing protein [Clostridia bacterium]|nr:helix-turn-helix domain-containing protein [Clostridia bacterium]